MSAEADLFMVEAGIGDTADMGEMSVRLRDLIRAMRAKVEEKLDR